MAVVPSKLTMLLGSVADDVERIIAVLKKDELLSEKAEVDGVEFRSALTAVQQKWDEEYSGSCSSLLFFV